MVYLTVKLSRYTPLRGYSCYSFLTSALDGVSGRRHALDVFYPRVKDPLEFLVKYYDLICYHSTTKCLMVLLSNRPVPLFLGKAVR
jgi:hypothetical protein